MKKKPIAIAIVAVLILAATVSVILLLSIKHANNGRLHADMVVTNANIGIPGISKMYEATLTNQGRLPARVTRCDFIDDTLSPGTSVAYAVQRWDAGSKRWVTVVEFG
jgi:hypothetical protein